MKNTDLILTNAIVVTMNPRGDLYNPGAIAIQDGQIAAVGTASEIAAQYAASETVDLHGKALIPGLVNAHTHVPMTLLRGLADDLRLDVWLMGYMMPVEREFVSPDFCRLGTLLACAEMIRSGVTAFADMYYYEEDVARATADAGMRAVCSQTVLKFPTPDAASYEESLAAAREYIYRWRGHPLIVPSVAPHAPYTCTPEILEACAELASSTDTPLHIHIAETPFEVEESLKLYDQREVPWVDRYHLFDAKVLAAHCVHVDQSEIRILKRAGAGVAHCPTSNLKLASGVAPVAKMLEQGLNVGIGTDGPASNNDLDMFEETRLAAILAKGITGDPTVVPAKRALEMATILGARALHMGHLAGSLEPGKRADLAVVDLNTTHNTPKFERDPNAIYSQIVYASKATDVTDVVVNGRWLMRDRRLLTLNEEELGRAAQDYARRIDRFVVEREQSVFNKLVTIGGTEREESFEVQVKARIADPAQVLNALEPSRLAVVRTSHYHEYDTYFFFAAPEVSRLRYREDAFVDDKNKVYKTRNRLTLIGQTSEDEFDNSILLSRSRLIAPAGQSLRFYREYFKPAKEQEIEKDRRRWLIRYKDTEFFVNLDQLIVPAREGYYLEVKSRTWSKRDAEYKARLISELLPLLGVRPDATIKEEYVRLFNMDPHAPASSRE
ncbi:MAG: amidohydrolase family protein [Anaerolineae bacterium]